MNVLKTLGLERDEQERDRLATRSKIKQQLDELELVKVQESGLADEIRRYNKRKDELGDELVEKRAPLTDRQTELQAAANQAIRDGKKLPEGHGLELEEIGRKIIKIDADFNYENAAIDRLIKETQLKIRALQPHLHRIPGVRSQLTAPGIANPRLLEDRFIADQQCRWLDSRVSAAREEYSLAEEALRIFTRDNSGQDQKVNGDNEKHWLRLVADVDRWLAELSAAQLEHEIAIQQRQRVRDAILAE